MYKTMRERTIATIVRILYILLDYPEEGYMELDLI